MLLSEYPDARFPAAPGPASDLAQAVAALESLAAAVSVDVTLAAGVRRWWSWRLQRAADYLGKQLVSEMGAGEV